jgi:two-component system, sensor histidine kinase RegB
MQLQLTSSPQAFLRTLLWLRVLAVVGQSATIALVSLWLQIDLPITPMVAVIAAFAVVAVLTAIRLRTAWPVTQFEIALHLLVDIGVLTALLYLSGGTTNPFTSLYLIPIALAAAGLSWNYAGLVTLTGLGCYGLLMEHSVPLRFAPANPAAAFNLHILGMGVNFAVCACLLGVTLSLMAGMMRHRDRAIAAMREDTLRQEHLNAMGVMAAGAAHELSTPLFAMAILVSELRSARKVDKSFTSDLDLLEQQIKVCKERLSLLLQAGGQPRSPERHVVHFRPLLQRILDSWSIVRPAVRVQLDLQALDGEPLVAVDEGFSQALTSLLNNAADASASNGSDEVRISATSDAEELRIYIDDEGSGMSAAQQLQAGKARFTTKSSGFGLGLVLSHANLNRLQGEMDLSDLPAGGTRTTIRLPISVDTGVHG